MRSRCSVYLNADHDPRLPHLTVDAAICNPRTRLGSGCAICVQKDEGSRGSKVAAVSGAAGCLLGLAWSLLFWLAIIVLILYLV